MHKKKILFIVHNYNTFQKDQIECVSSYFDVIYVLVRYNPIFRSLSYVFKNFKKFDRSISIDTINKPDNIKIFETPVFYLPYGFFNKLLGVQHFNSVLKTIKKYELKFDIIHAHFIWSSGFVASKLKQIYHKPVVITGHGYDVYCLPNKSLLWKNKIGSVLNSVDIVTTPSNSNIRNLTKITKNKVVLIPNGYNKNIFFPMDKAKCREKLGIDKNSYVIITVGSLEKIKGQIYLINACKILTKKYPNLLCFIVGGGSLEAYLNNKIGQYKLDKHVFLTGIKMHDKLPWWLNSSDLYITSSIRESFGLAQIEALACGIPVVATKNGGSEELINNDVGFLTNIKDDKDLAQKIDMALTKKWNNKNIVKYANQYSYEHIIEKFVEIYTYLIKDVETIKE